MPGPSLYPEHTIVVWFGDRGFPHPLLTGLKLRLPPPYSDPGRHKRKMGVHAPAALAQRRSAPFRPSSTKIAPPTEWTGTFQAFQETTAAPFTKRQRTARYTPYSEPQKLTILASAPISPLSHPRRKGTKDSLRCEGSKDILSGIWIMSFRASKAPKELF